MATSSASFAVDDADLLTEVPPYLKKLARMVARGFYNTAQILVVDALVRDPCVKEEDLSELLHMDKKMLRQALIILRRDRLIKSVAHTEKVEGFDQPKKFDYYFINFKSFVNVLKYKLDHMRKKIEADEKIAKNRQFYKCPRCGKEYGDLDINQLFDPFEHILKCTYCGGEVEEDHSLSDLKQSTISVAELNQLTEPLLTLIRQCENVKLAPTVLEPEPKPIKQLVEKRGEVANKSKKGPWTSGDRSINPFENSTGIQITLNQDNEQQKVVATREQPSWLAKSTVHVEEDTPVSGSPSAAPSPDGSGVKSSAAASKKGGSNHILTDLLIHESRASGNVPLPPGVTSTVGKRTIAQRQEEDDSSSEDDEAAAKRQAQALGSRSHLLESAAAAAAAAATAATCVPASAAAAAFAAASRTATTGGTGSVDDTFVCFFLVF
eukprot:scpid52782/ scgid4167/ General transcription factor IIE subunit 1; Transcription initiation factor IIE subunit alpha